MLASFLLEEPEVETESSLIRLSRTAMATRFEISLPMGTPNALEIGESVLDLIDELEDQLTIYRDHSEVSRLNATAFDRPVVVEKNLFELLKTCTSISNDTGGAFDVACGALSQVWGFTRREGRIPENAELNAALTCCGMKHVILDDSTNTVRYRRTGLQINLGSIGKGYALDRAALLLKKYGVQRAMLQAGGSSMLAIGNGWRVAISHPSDPVRTLGTVTLNNAAIATTAATYQHFEYNGKQYGHVIDPRTGRPAAALRSASAITMTAGMADALSTAFFVMGRERTTEWLSTREAVAAVVLKDDSPQTFGSLWYSPPSLGERIREVLTPPEW